MKERKLLIWEESNIVYGEIRLLHGEEQTLYEFRNLLSENIKNTKNLELLKDEGYPTKFDSNYILFQEKNAFEEGKKKLESYRKEYPEVPIHPGFFAFLLRTKRYKEWKRYIKRRDEKEKETWQIIDKLYSVMIKTNHDYPYLECYSKIHNKEELISEIKKVADNLSIKLEIIDKKPI